MVKQVCKIIRNKRAEGYVDVVVLVLCAMLVLAATGINQAYKQLTK